MRFYSRFVLFVIAVVYEIAAPARQFNGLIKFQPLEATLIILGYGAIFFNIFFVLMSLYWFITKRNPGIPRWIIYFNICIFPAQVYYFFFL
jgi:hypothetical protein